MALRIGVDAGGTFTDVCALDDETGEVHVVKLASTTADPAKAALEGVRRVLADLGRTASEVGYFAHGTTVATNTLLQLNGARTGLLVTDGFRDLLELGRQRRPRLYDLAARKPVPLVPRDLRLELRERLRHTGDVESALDEEEVRTAARRLREEDVEAVAVCFLYSYVSDEHERQALDILTTELPDAFISISSEVLPQFREFERLSTVVTNAYVGPEMSRYLGNLRENLRAEGITVPAHVTQSNGGVIPFRRAEALPVRTVLSGPSSGVIGAAKLAESVGEPNLITFDMGGTSSDVSLVSDGRPRTTHGMELNGRPIRSPMLDIDTVGAGGGSIAWIDSGGHLKVGPQSAGADPGPVCYGLGNTEPTVTDANVALGYLNQQHLLGGEMPIDAEASKQAVADLAERLGLDVMTTAEGIIRVVTANMARAIRKISVQRGYDPADYVLAAFGGAGPLHSGRLAAELGVSRVLVPASPGALCALGLLMTDVRTDFTRTRVLDVSQHGRSAVGSILSDLEREARAWFAEEEIEPRRQCLERFVAMRYAGQNYEIDLPLEAASVADEGFDRLIASFHRAHERLYGYNAPDDPIEAVTFRVEATGAVPQAEVAQQAAAGAASESARIHHRRAFFGDHGGWVDTAVYARELLRAGARIEGPALIDQLDTTNVVLPGERATVDGQGNLVVERTNPR